MNISSVLAKSSFRPCRTVTHCSSDGKLKAPLKIDMSQGKCPKVIEHDGDVFVFGDVQEGITIQATGDIAVWGKLNGHIHAGWPSQSAAKVHTLQTGDSGVVCIGGKLQRPGTDSVQSSERWTSVKAVRAGLFTGVFAMVLGAAITLFPNTVYGFLFDPCVVSTGIIRLGGGFLTLVGMQYFITSLGDSIKPQWSFYHSTVLSRLYLILLICILVSIAAIEANWLWFGGMNGIGALSMFKALHYK